MPKNFQGELQVQTQQQLMHLSPQQLMLVKLLEMPIAELEQHVREEVIDNVALEEGNTHSDNVNDNSSDYDATQDEGDDEYGYDDNDYDNIHPQDTSFDDYASPDDVPSYLYQQQESEHTEMPLGDTKSFMDDLNEQVAEFDLNEHERLLMLYLIGSLNNKGFIERDLRSMADDVIIYQGIDTSEEELEHLLHILQQFDPPGIGARNTQECLLIQIKRLQEADNERQNTDDNDYCLEYEIIDNHYDDFVNQRTDRLTRQLGVSETIIKQAVAKISRLNPQPGISLCESASGQVQTVIPDFIVETTAEGNISFTINCGDIPELHISNDYLLQLKELEKRGGKMSRSEREAFEYAQQKIESAKGFIKAIQQRRETLQSTMKAIIHFQREFILTQDESALEPMRLVDIAERVGLDKSTISRVRNSKYVQIDGTIYPLDVFFKRQRTNADGEVLEQADICDLIKNLIDNENKSEPLTDQQLESALRDNGFNISRRTVAKYRQQMGIPSTKQRKD